MKIPVAHLSVLAIAALAIAIATGSPVAAAIGDRTPSSAQASAEKASASLQSELDALAQRAAPGTLGIVVLDLRSGRQWRVNADRAYPMMSVFKAPVAATVLARIDAGQMSFEQTATVTRADLQGGPLTDAFHGDRMTFSVRELLTYAVSRSDNTAVNVLIKLIGGPQVVTAFLRTHGIEGMRVDLDEAAVGREFQDIADGGKPPANESPQQQDRRLQRGYKAYLADPRNRSTPDAAAMFLRKLQQGDLLPHASTQYLIDLMTAQTVPHRLRDGLPAGVRLADKCGTSTSLDGLTAAYNDIGILTWPDGHAVVIAAFLTASPAPETERHAIFIDLARETAAALHP